MRNINKDDLRWTKGAYDDEKREKMTYIETLTAMCDCYGTFSGRWHSNIFWAKTKEQIKDMDEEQAKQKVFEIENDADGSLAHYKRQYN